MNFDSLVDQVNDTVDLYIRQSCKLTTAAQLGLDPRAGYTLYANVDDCVIAVSNRNRGMLDYYGGFEYVDKENVTTLGGYTFYRGDECERVTGCLDYFEGKREGDEEEGE